MLCAQCDPRRFKAITVWRRRDAKHGMTTSVVRHCEFLFLENLKMRNTNASAKVTVDKPTSSFKHLESRPGRDIFVCISCGAHRMRRCECVGRHSPSGPRGPGNRRTSGDGLWTEPKCRPEAGSEGSSQRRECRSLIEYGNPRPQGQGVSRSRTGTSSTRKRAASCFRQASSGHQRK